MTEEGARVDAGAAGERLVARCQMQLVIEGISHHDVCRTMFSAMGGRYFNAPAIVLKKNICWQQRRKAYNHPV